MASTHPAGYLKLLLGEDAQEMIGTVFQSQSGFSFPKSLQELLLGKSVGEVTHESREINTGLTTVRALMGLLCGPEMSCLITKWFDGE